MKTRLLHLVAIAATLPLCSCGGGGGGGGAKPILNATFQIVWPARSRTAFSSTLTSALSVAVDFPKAGANGADVTMDVNRDTTQLGGYTGTYTLSTPVYASAVTTLTATFYGQAGELGPMVGSATAAVSTSGTSLQVGTFVLSGVIKSVAVFAQPLVIGTATTNLQFSCKDGSGNLVVVTPGSASWAVVSGGSFLSLTQDGVASPLAPGAAEVTATVDGVASPQTAITVTAGPDFMNPSFELPAIASGSYLEQVGSVTDWTGSPILSGQTEPGFGIANGSGPWGTGAEDGSQYAFLQSGSTLATSQGWCEQTITGLTLGQAYEVTFWMAQRNGDVGGNTGEPISVTLNGSTIFPATAPTTDAKWNQYTTQSFTASSSSVTIRFTTQPPSPGQDQSTLLDNVHLLAVQ